MKIIIIITMKIIIIIIIAIIHEYQRRPVLILSLTKVIFGVMDVQRNSGLASSLRVHRRL